MGLAVGVVEVIAEIIDSATELVGVLGGIGYLRTGRISAGPILVMAVLLSFSSPSSPLRVASALLSWICKFLVRASDSPNDKAAFGRTCRSVSIFCF